MMLFKNKAFLIGQISGDNAPVIVPILWMKELSMGNGGCSLRRKVAGSNSEQESVSG